MHCILPFESVVSAVCGDDPMLDPVKTQSPGTYKTAVLSCALGSLRRIIPCLSLGLRQLVLML